MPPRRSPLRQRKIEFADRQASRPDGRRGSTADRRRRTRSRRRGRGGGSAARSGARGRTRGRRRRPGAAPRDRGATGCRASRSGRGSRRRARGRGSPARAPTTGRDSRGPAGRRRDPGRAGSRAARKPAAALIRAGAPGDPQARGGIVAQRVERAMRAELRLFLARRGVVVVGQAVDGDAHGLRGRQAGAEGRLDPGRDRSEQDRHAMGLGETDQPVEGGDAATASSSRHQNRTRWKRVPASSRRCEGGRKRDAHAPARERAPAPDPAACGSARKDPRRSRPSALPAQIDPVRRRRRGLELGVHRLQE